ncbi:MAG TPA: PilZ domain-containing protein [Cellvibrionaceae bacterium]
MTNPERRRFQRLEFNVRVELAQSGLHWHAWLVDISLKGLLIRGLLPEDFDALAPVHAEVILSDQTSIAMTTAVAHQSATATGLACLSIDLDSIRHLRRMMELNLGDAKAAERELSELMD